MAAVSLPSSPGPRASIPRLLDFGGKVQGSLGGAAQRVNRLGNRWAFDFQMPVMTQAQARTWSAALAQGLRNGVLFRLRQLNLTVLSPGTPLVNGADQAGYVLAADGFLASYALIAGQFISITTDSRKYLYMIGQDVAANGSGVASLPLEPALRISPADNDPIEISAPYIEGLLVESPSWSLDPDHLARGFSFTIEEAR